MKWRHNERSCLGGFLMKRGITMITLFVLLLSACAGTINSKEKPLLHETTVHGEHGQLARCVINRLTADPRSFMQIFHYKSRAYPGISATEVHAYDTRFLPYVYASNSPQNPDAVRDYSSPSPEVMHHARNLIGAEYTYGFAFTLQQVGEEKVAVALKGNRYVGGIAWGYLQGCVGRAP